MEMFLAFFACRTTQLCPISFLQHKIMVNVLDIIFRCINAKVVLDSTLVLPSVIAIAIYWSLCSFLRNPLENAKETCNVRTMPVPNTAVQFETEFKKLKKDVKLFYEYFQVTYKSFTNYLYVILKQDFNPMQHLWNND